MGFALIWMLCGVVAYMIGSKKGEGICAFFAGLLFGPIGILIALLGKGNRKGCSYCKELMHKEAIVCPHCQRSVADTQVVGGSKNTNTGRNRVAP